jgi:hypothetical protein
MTTTLKRGEGLHWPRNPRVSSPRPCSSFISSPPVFSFPKFPHGYAKRCVLPRGSASAASPARPLSLGGVLAHPPADVPRFAPSAHGLRRGRDEGKEPIGSADSSLGEGRGAAVALVVSRSRPPAGGGSRRGPFPAGEMQTHSPAALSLIGDLSRPAHASASPSSPTEKVGEGGISTSPIIFMGEDERGVSRAKEWVSVWPPRWSP